MPQPVVYIDTSAIREGKLAELEKAMQKLAGFVEGNVPRVLSYGFYFDDDRTEMTVVAVHPDSASLEFHLDAGREEFRKFSTLIELKRIEVYGPVSNAVRERLHRKAQVLGGGTVTVRGLYAGFFR